MQLNLENLKQLLEREEELHPDLAEHLTEGPCGLMLAHPLVRELQVDPHHAAYLNWRYHKKLEGLDRACERGDWYTWIWLHERAYRCEAFTEIAYGLPDKEYWSLLSSVWIDSESVYQNLTLWRELWNDDLTGKEHAMDATERQALKALPDEVTVYRGAGEGRNVRGMSWTLDRKKAIWFATVRNDSPHVLLTARARKSHAHALLLGRKESEIVLDQFEIIGTDYVEPAELRA